MTKKSANKHHNKEQGAATHHEEHLQSGDPHPKGKPLTVNSDSEGEKIDKKESTQPMLPVNMKFVDVRQHLPKIKDGVQRASSSFLTEMDGCYKRVRQGRALELQNLRYLNCCFLGMWGLFHLLFPQLVAFVYGGGFHIFGQGFRNDMIRFEGTTALILLHITRSTTSWGIFEQQEYLRALNSGYFMLSLMNLYAYFFGASSFSHLVTFFIVVSWAFYQENCFSVLRKGKTTLPSTSASVGAETQTDAAEQTKEEAVNESENQPVQQHAEHGRGRRAQEQVELHEHASKHPMAEGVKREVKSVT